MPRGSILHIEAKDLLAGGNILVWNKVTEHNRSEFSISNNRIEKQTRMSNGTMRKFFIADKKSFSLSWSMLPSYRSLTVDNGWGAEDLRSFYNSDAGRGAFQIKVNLAKDGTDQTSNSAAYEIYNVVFASCEFTVVKRGIQPHWSVNITLEEV